MVWDNLRYSLIHGEKESSNASLGMLLKELVVEILMSTEHFVIANLWEITGIPWIIHYFQASLITRLLPVQDFWLLQC